MAKKNVTIEIDSYGRYTEWNRESKELPKLIDFITDIPAEKGNEFGMILHIKKGKGKKVDFCIKHPPIRDEKGDLMPDFKGTYHINYNDFKFFIGDGIWPPEDEKRGKWIVQVFFEGKKVAEKIFNIY